MAYEKIQKWNGELETKEPREVEIFKLFTGNPVCFQASKVH